MSYYCVQVFYVNCYDANYFYHLHFEENFEKGRVGVPLPASGTRLLFKPKKGRSQPPPKI